MWFILNQRINLFFSSIVINLLLFCIIALMARLALIWGLKDPLLDLNDYNLLSVFTMGARFDLKIGVIIAALLSIPVAFLKYESIAFKIWRLCIWFLVLIILVSNYYYFSFYGSPFNVLVFGLFEDDTQAIIQTLVSDF